MSAELTYLKNGDTLVYDADACVGCGRCETVCPHGVFGMTRGKAVVIRRGACMECGACRKNCPAEAITVRVGTGCATGLLFSLFGGKGACCNQEVCCAPPDEGSGGP